MTCMSALIAGGPLLGVGAGSYSESNVGSTESVSIQYNSTGTISIIKTLAGTVTVQSWIQPNAFAPGSYTIRAHVNSGSLTSGTVDTDLALSSTRTFTVTQSSGGTHSVNMTMTLKDGGGNTVASGTVALSATF